MYAEKFIVSAEINQCTTPRPSLVCVCSSEIYSALLWHRHVMPDTPQHYTYVGSSLRV